MAGRINFKLTKKKVESSTIKHYIVPTPIRYSTIGRSELLEQTFDAILHEMEQMLCNGHGLEFGDLGTFRFGLDMKAKPQDKKDEVGADLIKRKRIIFTPSVSTKKDMQECAKVITENKFALPH